MLNIEGINSAIPPQAPEPVSRVAAERVTELAQGQDVIELSEVARLAAKIQELPEVRADLVARVKAEIENGTYETPERLEIAVTRLMEELLPD